MRRCVPGSNRIEAGELLDELLALGCTVIAPTFTYDLEQPAPAGDRPSQNGWAYDEWMPLSHERRFDIRGQHLSLSEMGIFPATMLSRSECVRGNHPINSFAEVGPRASEMIEMQAPHRVYGPFEKLCEEGAGFAGGRGLHQPNAPAFRRAVLWTEPFSTLGIGCSGQSYCLPGRRLFRRVQCFRRGAISYDELVGNARLRVLEAATVVEQAVSAIRSEPKIGRCGNPQCQRCCDASLGGPIFV